MISTVIKRVPYYFVEFMDHIFSDSVFFEVQLPQLGSSEYGEPTPFI